MKNYIACDMCGRKIGYTGLKYLIKPKAKVFSYRMDDYHDNIFTEELDICENCWNEMEHYIKIRKRDKE